MGRRLAVLVCLLAPTFAARAAEPPPMVVAWKADPAAAVREVVYAVRAQGRDGHWYANIGYWCPDPAKKLYGGRGGRLAKLDLETGKVTVLVDDPKGDVRDPAVDYDGRTILFSWRKGGTDTYHLYTIRSDGSALVQLTSGPWDDYESCWLPCGDIVFTTTRGKRWVGCWFTQVGILFRMARDGSGMRAISTNIEHDNTPAVLPDGRVLYTRWEYVDRSQVDFHHLWVFKPDGTGVMTYFGNMHPGIVMIDARPVPGTDRVLAVFSPGHGRCEHAGNLTVVDPNGGPDARGLTTRVEDTPGDVRDPYPLSPRWALACRRNELLRVDMVKGGTTVLHREPDLWVHEVRPLRPRPREPVLADRVRRLGETGRFVLVDVAYGRQLGDVKPGEIKRLLVLETLPKPVNFSGGPDTLTWLGTFNLERVLGVVPVEADGSAHFEAPANRPLFFVALDERDRAVKRMHSFTSVMPGESVSCVGCHEPRTKMAHPAGQGAARAALARPPSKIEPFEGVPDVLDFPRDVQPILDRHCTPCHNPDRRAGKVVLTGDRGPRFSLSYWTLFARDQVADGRNAWGSEPRTVGAGASALMTKVDGSHHDVTLSAREWRTLWCWIESGATYPGTYAALQSGCVGVPMFANPKREGPQPPTAPVLERRCGECHALPPRHAKPAKGQVPLLAFMGRAPGARHQRVVCEDDPLARFSPNALFNLTRPEKSLLLMGPLAKKAGGYETCRKGGVFQSTGDPDYRLLAKAIARAGARLEEIKRFDMPGFRPNVHYVREMQRFGILPEDHDPAAPLDVYATDQAYWRSLWPLAVPAEVRPAISVAVRQAENGDRRPFRTGGK